VDFVEICNVYVGKMIIKAAKRIFNCDKICRSYSDLNFGVTFLEHSVFFINTDRLIVVIQSEHTTVWQPFSYWLHLKLFTLVYFLLFIILCYDIIIGNANVTAMFTKQMTFSERYKILILKWYQLKGYFGTHCEELIKLIPIANYAD